MTLLSKTNLQLLADVSDGQTCVSIYMPTHKAGPEIRQDPIRLKNLVRDAEEKLAAQGYDSRDVGNLLEPDRISALIDDADFWRHQSDGLALFIAPDSFHRFHLPINFEEHVVVSDRFYLKPLMPILKNDGRFFLLSLSQNQVNLYVGNRHSIVEIDLRDTPTSLKEVLRYDEKENQLQFHTQGRGIDPLYHGQGVGTTDNKDELRRFCNIIDNTVQELLKDERSPLVLAGVDYLTEIYRECSSYSNLLDRSVTGNPENVDLDDLHQQAWATVEPYFQESQRQAVDQYHHLKGTGQATSSLQDIVVAAYEGQVDTLFVADGAYQWGNFSPQERTVEMHADESPGANDLLNMAAIYTFINGGTVYAVHPDHMPVADAAAAAIFRYPIMSGVGAPS
ncbi:MAG: hypothetical protein ACFE0J_04955 [Elainellaceae cyanobacterium]